MTVNKYPSDQFEFVAEAGAIAKSGSIFTNFWARLDFPKFSYIGPRLVKICPHWLLTINLVLFCYEFELS